MRRTPGTVDRAAGDTCRSVTESCLRPTLSADQRRCPRRLHHGRQRPLGGAARPAPHRGHTEGEENLARLVRVAVRRDIGWLTVFGFSTENWIRPRAEVRHILGLHEKLFGRVAELNELNVRIQWIGRPFDSPDARTPKYVQRAIRKAIADTSANTGMLLTVAFDYGARPGADRRRRAACGPRGAEVTPAAIAEPPLPAGAAAGRRARAHERRARVSNFLLWQAPAPRSTSPSKTWPDFDARRARRRARARLTSLRGRR